MFSSIRYKDYTPLWSAEFSAVKSKNYFRIILVLVVVLLASGICNTVFFVKLARSWPAPLDAYQHLNTQPIVNIDALSSLVPPNAQDNAIVTSLYTDGYATAVAALGHSLNKVNTTASRLLLYIPEQISPRALCIATASGFIPHPVARIAPPHGGRGVGAHFADQYSKLNLWTLDESGFKSVVYLDADTLVHRNFDELFGLPYSFAAVPDVYAGARGYVVGFNAGVLVLRPSTAVFLDMLRDVEGAAYAAGEAEQAFLNHYYAAEALRLPYAYNANLVIKERTPALWAGLRREARVVHYTVMKPFLTDLHGWRSVVGMQEVERHVLAQIGARGGLFDEEVRAWLEMWRETRHAYDEALTACTRVSTQ
ncbi:nucleotide-diphospho-sugar transferase [Amylocystis lapponica]|nr:nucleotide-diphospho-sugar transferase [Amylocystis lapponica]